MGFFDFLGKGGSIDVSGLADKIWEKIWPWAQAKLDETVDQYTPIVVEKLLSMLPMIVATAVKAAIEHAFESAPGLPNVVLPDAAQLAERVIREVVDSDPDIPGLSGVIDLSELFRSWLPK